MNILIPDSWLREHVQTKASPEEIQSALSLCGPSVERIYDREGEAVYDIEVTTNRVDCFSVRGIAREAAVILPQFGHVAELVPATNKALPKPTESAELPLPKITDNNKLVRRLICVVLRDVERTPTPEWMAKRLRQIEVNVHDSVIDITNYITHELGHPCHAFDYDLVMQLGGEIIVQEAKPGMPFTTLDGNSYTTVGGEVVFINPTGEVIDLPSIKGTANSSITDQTKNILLLLESPEPSKVRFASMTHAIRTQAAQILEKGIDTELMYPTLRRGVELYQELTGAQIASPLFDHYPQLPKVQATELSLERVQDYLGVEMAAGQIKDILMKLGCHVEALKKGSLRITPPSFRRDLAIPADYIEEVARIYGYHNLPSVLMDTPIPTIYPEGTNFPLEDQVKQLLADLGYQELYTYSMISAELAEKSGAPADQHLRLRNALSSDNEYLRRHLLPSHLLALGSQPEQAKLHGTFELANVYEPRKGDLPDERLMLGILDHNLRSLRRTLDLLFSRLHISSSGWVIPESNTKIDGYNQEMYSSSSVSTLDGRLLGTLGYLRTQEGEPEWAGAELDWKVLLAASRKTPTYHPLPDTAPVKEDLTLTIPEGTPVGAVLERMKQADPLVTSVTFKDQYQQNWTFTVTYQDPTKQLGREDVVPARQKLVAAAQAHGAKLVG